MVVKTLTQSEKHNLLTELNSICINLTFFFSRKRLFSLFGNSRKLYSSIWDLGVLFRCTFVFIFFLHLCAHWSSTARKEL